MSAVGMRIRQAREALGMSYTDVTVASKGITQAYLNKLEKGVKDKPSPELLRRLSEALDVPYLELMELAGYVRRKDLQEYPFSFADEAALFSRAAAD